MKDRERKPGVLTKLARLVTHNWGLKLLSLVLAILIYYAIKPAADSGAAKSRKSPAGGAFTVPPVLKAAEAAIQPSEHHLPKK